MKRIFLSMILSVSLVFIAGCANAGVIADLTQPSADKAAQNLSQLTSADLTAAALISTNAGDVAGANCANALKDWLATISLPAASATEPVVIGPASAFAAARVHVQGAQGVLAKIKAGVPDTVHIACAPVVLDANMLLLKLGAIFGAATLAPGLAPVGGALPVPLP